MLFSVESAKAVMGVTQKLVVTEVFRLSMKS